MGGPGGFCMSGLRQGISVKFSERCGHTRSLTGTFGKEEHPRLGILAKLSLRLWRIENCQGKGKMKHSAKCNNPVQKAALEEHAVQLL